MNILAIDTSNQVMGVAIWKDSVLKAEYTTNIKRNHSIGLMPAIDHIMKEADIFPKELDRIVVAKGPGSYTGVRIGVSIAKTMAWTLNIPIVSISSLELLAYNGMGHAGYICPFFDARRGLVYTGLFEGKAKELHLIKKEQNIDFKAWLDQVKEVQKPILFLSQDLYIHQKVIEEKLGELALFPSLSIDHLPRPGILAELGEKLPVESTHALTPNYLRLVEAEANWLKEQGKKSNE
ncbi:tRNA (adenosine(37)-N6)-threonylcarbamoyltransferase complex dimerization subunit type 1 TsaB [Gracilibacillus dipsosauri]|uniref:tRNA (adenosine(37)-N6)-threonylcarbamoyltransferase complex dimerization subunit type 1 TsaB n=1 Tax=Gracilibacillus dipsosauri TaxID=178340 RepID=UPI002409FF18